MRGSFGLRKCVTVAALAAGVCATSPAHAQSGDGENADLVDKGRLVSTIAGCSACHSADGGEAYAGGLVLNTPFGELASPNITQDEATGIGGWTYDDFKSVIHRGISKEVGPLYPAMPYVHYTMMRDEDVEALWAYMQTISPVENEVVVNRLPFPFDVRQGLYAWRRLYLTEGRFEPDPDRSEEWNRGAYIIQAMAHCGACHTPRDALGGYETDRTLMGAQIEEWYAPDISNGPNSIIADWSEDRLVSFLSGESHRNHVALGSMSRVVDDLSMIPESDVRAIAVYLKAQSPTGERQTAEPVDVSDETRAAWAEVYELNCQSCHGADGEGEPGVAASMVNAGGVVAAEPSNVISVMLEGVAANSDYGLMPSFRDTLTNAEIAAVANHVRTSWGNDAPPNATPQMVSWLRNQTETAPGVQASAICPNVATDAVSEPVREAIDAVADSDTLDEAAISKVAEAWRSENPDANMTDELVTLGGTFCRRVAESGADRETVAERNLAFWNGLIRQSAQ